MLIFVKTNETKNLSFACKTLDNKNGYNLLILVNRRCPWCNGYRRREMDTATRVQILDETAFHIALIPFGKV